MEGVEEGELRGFEGGEGERGEDGLKFVKGQGRGAVFHILKLSCFMIKF